MTYSPISLDIAQLLFEFTARADRQSAVTLTRVSREVHTWITPILYHSVHVQLDENDISQADQLQRSIEANSSLASWTRRLAFTGDPNAAQEVITSLIQACPSLSSLSVIPTQHRTVLDISLPTSLNELTWEAWGFKVKVSDVPQLKDLTHLHIITMQDTKSNQAAMVLPILLANYQLPLLSRVAFTFPPLQIRDSGAPLFPFVPFANSLMELLPKMANLQLCVLCFKAYGPDTEYVWPQPALDMIRGDLHPKIVVVGDEGFVGVDPELLILSGGGFRASDWLDMSSWERTEDHLRLRNGRRAIT